jgi:hypothetical protein
MSAMRSTQMYWLTRYRFDADAPMDALGISWLLSDVAMPIIIVLWGGGGLAWGIARMALKLG